MKVENKTIIITDPCYLIPYNKDDDWGLCDYGESMYVLGFKNYESRNTIYGDWSCTVYEGEYTTVPDEKNTVLGGFTADAGMVGVFELDEVLKYNPDFNLYKESPWCVTIIPDFTGEVNIEVIDEQVHVIGKGNINFFSIQSGL